MRSSVLKYILVILLSTLLVGSQAYAQAPSSKLTIKNDVSWPNCDDYPTTAEGIVGVTGGLDFTMNQCIHKEISWFSSYELYMNTGYPGIKYALKYQNSPRNCSNTDNTCLAYNFGYNAALYGLKSAAFQGAYSNKWWLDVETVNSWSNQTAYNRADLAGMVAAIKANTLLSVVGFYSDPFQWTTITGNWKNKLPNWVATGTSSLSTAVASCRGNNFTDGDTELTQYTIWLDQNYVCPQN